MVTAIAHFWLHEWLPAADTVSVVTHKPNALYTAEAWKPQDWSPADRITQSWIPQGWMPANVPRLSEEASHSKWQDAA